MSIPVVVVGAVLVGFRSVIVADQFQRPVGLAIRTRTRQQPFVLQPLEIGEVSQAGETERRQEDCVVT
jgi:hypothetical protein